MLAPHNQEPNFGAIMGNSMEKWYNEIDNALEISESIPNTYKYTVATSYGNVGKIPENQTTFFDILANGLEVVSVENSFITLDMDVTLTLNANYTVATIPVTEFYVGFLHSAAAIQSYKIYSEADLIQTINHANWEWMVYYNSFSDEVKENNSNFATIKKIRSRNQFVPGVYIDLKTINAAANPVDITFKIPLKIPLSSFLLFTNIKWLPRWMGKFRIEITPSYRNIVVAPVIPQEMFTIFPDINNKMNTVNNAAVANSAEDTLVEFGWYQLNQPMRNRFTLIYNEAAVDLATRGWTADFAIANVPLHTFGCRYQETDRCHIRLATYMLKADVFSALAFKYAEIPLVFPIQLVEAKNMTQPLTDNNGQPIASFNTAQTITLRHCDTMFCYFREDIVNSTQRFVNPMITGFQFNIDGNFYPREAMNSIEDRRHENQTLDALNINNSSFSSIPEDMRTSITPFTRRINFTDTGVLGTDSLIWTTGSMSNYFLGIPFADSEVFQGGISTSGTIQVELKATRNPTPCPKIQKKLFVQPTVVWLMDAVLFLRSIKPIGRPQAEINTAPIEQIMLSLGAGMG
jgi:hypothetical protein